MGGAFLLAVLLAAADPAPAKGQALSHWYQGPVRYLLSRREEKEFKALPNDAARSEWIRTFWRLHDPVPETPENEARITFWRRVVEANHLFDDSAAPGWKTDRGKIYILIGPPTDIQEDPDYNVKEQNIVGTGLLRWLYEGTLRVGSLGGVIVVPFIRGNDGAYHISTSAKYSSPAFDPLSGYDREGTPVAKIQSQLDYGPSDLGVAMDQGLLMTAPWQDKDFIERVTSEAYTGALPGMLIGFDYLRAGDGSTFALINCGVPFSAFAKTPTAPERPDVSALARLSPKGGGETIDVPAGSFSPAPTNAAARGDDLLLYQARVPLRPGSYDLWVGVFERFRLQSGNVRISVQVPDLSGPLSLSTIALGRSVRPLPEGAGGYNRPFRISDFEIIPAVSNAYRKDQTFAALWQIYTNGTSGPGSGLQVTYRFVLVQNGEEHPVGKPIVVDDAEAVQAYSVPMADWPAGDYRFKVSVRDRTGRQAEGSAGFHIQ